mmetsp:Transcript_18214/g.48084  ORF Transcript_18214/g.48084 Transcript_18214/m.48084 type:complete len:228 (+) Transcript_18214:42-725(+)
MMLRRIVTAAARPSSMASMATRAFGGAPDWHGTTILCVRKEGKTVLIGDGQVSQGSIVVKPNAKKVRRLEGGVLAGFAGSTADAFTLLERLEERLEEHPGQLTRACVDLAKAWRTDKYLRRLEAVLLVCDSKVAFEITGNGDVLEPRETEGGVSVMGVGSGGAYALSAARALADMPGVDAETIARKSMEVAADMCVYTNHNFVIETLDENDDGKEDTEEGEKEKEAK